MYCEYRANLCITIKKSVRVFISRTRFFFLMAPPRFQAILPSGLLLYIYIFVYYIILCIYIYILCILYFIIFYYILDLGIIPIHEVAALNQQLS